MPETVEQLVERIDEATAKGFRGKLVARGLARNMIWHDGITPEGSAAFSPLLSSDLLGYGLALFSIGLRLRTMDITNPAAVRAFERAGEAIESVVRDGDPTWSERGFYTVVAAAAYHLGHFSARAFSLITAEVEALNLSPAEKALTWLMRRNLYELHEALFAWAGKGGFDQSLVNRISAEQQEELDLDQVLQFSLNSLFHKALASFDLALESGSAEAQTTSIRFLAEGIAIATEFESVPFWWIFTIARHLLDDLWDHSLHMRLPGPVDDAPDSRWGELRQLFIALLQRRDLAEIELWPSQLAAAKRAVDVTDDLIAALPTSAGKTRIAELCILRTLALGGRIVFVTPLRALSAQTERTLRRTFSSLGFDVSSLYGASGSTGDDVDSLRNRDIVVSTPEKLDFALRNDSTLLDDVTLIVLDEAHTIGAGEREIRYEVLVQRLLRRADAANRRIVCLSAILPKGDQLQDFVDWVRQDQAGDAITCDWRPTRQRRGVITWENGRARLELLVETEKPFVEPFITETAARPPRRKAFPSNQAELTLGSAWQLVSEGQTVLIYCPERRSVIPLAQATLKLHRGGYLDSVIVPANAPKLTDALTIGREWLGRDHPAVQCLELGIAVHHGTLPRPFLRAVEHLLREQILKVTIASPTLAQGLNLSATSVLFHALTRSGKPISGEEFANVAGRAGRAFVDVEGRVICVAWDRKQVGRWNRLLKAAQQRDLRSGLLQLVLELCTQLATRTHLPLEKLIEYVTGNMAAWEPPPSVVVLPGQPKPDSRDGDPREKWRADLACVDAALLSLLQHDASTADLARMLDDALQSSLWQRSLQRLDQPRQNLSRALLLGRAKFIWQNSTAAQRKGYFFAGVSFTTGRYLDEHSAALEAHLRAADEAFAARDLETAMFESISFARIVFAIDPFKPDELPDDWEQILRAWVSGESMSDLAGGKDAEVLEFIQSALVYGLVWALEAVRVRTAANTDEIDENAFAGRAALALETGTPTYSAALLIQSSFPSRIAAMQAVRDCPATFSDMRGLRAWLRSDAVLLRQSDPVWPTAETASLWRDYIRSFSATASENWEERAFELAIIWFGPVPVSGAPLRLFHDAQSERTLVFSAELDSVGEIRPALSAQPTGIVMAHVSGDDRLAGTYLGPRDFIV